MKAHINKFSFLIILRSYDTGNRNGLSNKYSYAEMIMDDEQDSRDERAFRMWINSLGIDTFVHDLFNGVKDGYDASYNDSEGFVRWRLASSFTGQF